MKVLENRIFKLVGVPFDGDITYQQHDGMYVKYDGKNAVIGYGEKAHAARALFQLATAVKNNATELELDQKPQFSTLGVMLNSTSALQSVDGLKKYVDYLAAMGMNMLMLYTEDAYQMEAYPYFGHQKPRYTIEEFRTIDEYAKEMGVEMIPCIQTLAHLRGYLKWPEAKKIAQTDWTLMVGEEETYKFIEEEIKTMRKGYSSRRIHIGMDEASDLGYYKYMQKNGYRNRFDIFNEHLKRVVEICKKYDFQPMIWSDMYFSLGGKQRYDYDELVEVPREAIEKMPDVGMVFWDYYHDYQSFYDINIEKHQSFGKETYFAGAVWDFDGYAPNFAYSLKTMRPALTACCQKGIKHVFSTTWGSGETHYMDTLLMLPIFSEMCYLGENCKDEDIYKMVLQLRGASKEYIEALSALYLGLDGWASATQRLVDTDTLINLTHYELDYDFSIAEYTKALAIIQSYTESENAEQIGVAFYSLLADICLEKSKLMKNLQTKYKTGDKAYLKETAEKTLPQLSDKYAQFIDLLCKRWRDGYKSAHLEALTTDLYGTKGRVEYAAKVISEYLSGKIDRIGELEVERLKGATLLYPAANYHQV